VSTPDELAGFSLLQDLSPAHVATVAGLARPVSFGSGDEIFKEGGEANRCWLLTSGQVALETALPNGSTRRLQTLGPGDVLGWSWLVAPHRWRCDGVAVSAVRAVELDGRRLRELAEQDSTLGYPIAVRLVEALAERLHGTRARLIDVYGTSHAS
jgi:CRP-like cAMP-binding protein